MSGGFYIVHETDERHQCQGKQKKGIFKTTRQEISQCAEIEDNPTTTQSHFRMGTPLIGLVDDIAPISHLKIKKVLLKTIRLQLSINTCLKSKLIKLKRFIFFCLTDIIKDKEGEDHIRNWMRNKNTIEFLGTWEILNNPDFKGVEFDTFLNQAGLNRFNMTPQKWIEATNAIGIVSKAGRNGGTYAHKDIALEFCSWFNPTFKLYLFKRISAFKRV